MSTDTEARGESLLLAPHIVLVTGTLEGGGAERVMSDMANYWSKRGWRVQLVTWTGKEVADFYCLTPGVERVWLSVGPERAPFNKLRSNIARVFALRRLLKQSRPDVVLSFIDVPNVLTILAAAGLNLRVVVSERNDLRRTSTPSASTGAYHLAKAWQFLRRMVYRWADQVTALNKEAAQWIERECSVSVKVIPNPLRELPTLVLARERFILGVGRLGKEKGFDVLINAFAKVADAFPDWRLVIIGHGPEYGDLFALRDVLGSRDRIEINKPVTDIENWMARAGLIALPSRFEAYGNAILESLGMGAPVISTRCGGPPTFITDGVNARLVPVDDVDALAAAMSELMADPALRAALGREALKVRDTHRQDLIMRQWESCLFPDRSADLDSNELSRP